MRGGEGKRERKKHEVGKRGREDRGGEGGREEGRMEGREGRTTIKKLRE